MIVSMKTMGDPDEVDKELEQIRERIVVVRPEGDGEKELRDRTKWTPSPEQFAAYLAREIEMAKANIVKHGPTSTLHSSNTITRAQEELLKEGK